MTDNGKEAPELDSGTRSLALALLCAGSFLAVLDTTIVSIALPSIRRELGFAGADAQWILNGYALAFGGLLLLSGRTGDLLGRRRMFVAGLLLFGFTSLAAGLASAPWVLIAARVLQGVGGAALVPASLSLVTVIFAEGEEHNRALGIYGAMAAVGFVCGMVGGGIITEFLGWSWVFFAGVAPALAVAAASLAVVPESRGETAPHTLDVPGAATITLGLASLIYGISSVPDYGWASPRTGGFAALGLLLLGVFVAVESRSDAPLVPLAVFWQRTVTVPNAAVVLQSMVGIAWLYVLTLYFQEALGRTPLAAGLLFLPMTAASVVAAPVAGRLATHFGLRPTASIGLVLVAVGLLLMATIREASGLLLVIVGTVVGESGFMLSNVPLTIAATSAVGEEERGLGAGVLNTSIQIGNAFGLGVIATVVAAAEATSGGEQAGAEALVGGLRWGLLTCVAFAASGLLLVLVCLHEEKPREGLEA